MNGFLALIRRDLRLSTRLGGGALTGVLFFLAVVTVIPFGVGPDMALLGRIGPAILWIGALLATLLTLDRLFQADRDDGALDLILAAPLPLELVVVAKCIAHWIATGLPLVASVPVLALFVNLEPEAIAACVATLAVGTPALTAIGAIGAALTVTLRRGGVLMAILVLPFAVPVLIFGVAATTAAVTEPAPFLPPFLVLAGLGLISFVVGPIAAAAALRIAAE